MRYKFDPKIDPEFEGLIPPLSDEEFRQLEENILEVGECREPLVTWNKILLDGHNRWKIIQKHPGEVEYECREMIFNSRNEAMAWMIRNQLGRRNLPDYVKVELNLKLKPLLAEEAEKRMKSGVANPVTTLTQGCDEPKAGRVRTQIAKASGVSEGTVAKVEKIIAKAPEEVKTQLRLGEVSINKAYNAVRERERPTTPPPPVATIKEEARQMQEPEEPHVPTYTLDDLVSELNGNADTFISFIRSTLAVRSGMYADAASRKKIFDAIHGISIRLSEIENLVR